MSIDSAITRQEDAAAGLRLLHGVRRAWHHLRVAVGASAGTLACFLVLPLMETITASPDADLLVRGADVASLPPPPPPPEPEPEKEEPEDEPPPQLQEPQAPLDLSQLEMALNPGTAGDWGVADFTVKLGPAAAGGEGAMEELFNVADLDQKPRVVHQPGPTMDAHLRRRTPATVQVVFVVDQRGKVEEPRVQSATDPQFERAALAAVKQWKFEPGKRAGQPVRFRMRVPITFPKES